MSNVVITSDGESESDDQTATVDAAVAANDAQHHSDNAEGSASEAESNANAAMAAADSAARSDADAEAMAAAASLAAANAQEAASDAEAIANDTAQRIANAVVAALKPPDGEATVITQTEDGESQVDITAQDQPPRAQHWLERPVFGRKGR